MAPAAWRIDYRLCGDVRTCSRPIFDNDLLTEPLRQPVRQNPGYSVSTAARRIPNEPSHWPRRIGLCPRYARYDWKSSSSSSQMQKPPTGRFDRDLPFHASLFDNLVGAGEQRRRNFQAEHLGSGQVDDEVELGLLLNRDVSWFRPTKNLVDKVGGAPEHVRPICPIRHQ